MPVHPGAGAGTDHGAPASRAAVLRGRRPRHRLCRSEAVLTAGGLDVTLAGAVPTDGWSWVRASRPPGIARGGAGRDCPGGQLEPSLVAPRPRGLVGRAPATAPPTAAGLSRQG